jgi:hypothetical protein
MNSSTIMIFGLGDLGGHVLEFLARVPNIPKIVTVDVNEDWGIRKTNSAVLGASQFGLYPDIEFIPQDVSDVEATAILIRDVRPAILYNSMTMFSWWVITQLPPDAYKAIDAARYAPWFPVHFVPAWKLMQAVQRSGGSPRVVNAAFPDLVNPVLAKIGLAPTVGIGNVDNAVCSLRLVAARMLSVPLRSIAVYLVAPHYVSYYLSRFGTTGGAPYYLKVMADDRDVTSTLSVEKLFADIPVTARRTGGIHAHPVVASSVCKIILGIAFDTGEIGHAPGPNGLPGGYPVRLGANGAEVFLPEGISLEEAVRINNEGQVLEGIESIEADGTVVLTERTSAIFKKLLDYDCRRYSVRECEEKAIELKDKFHMWASRFR